MTHPIATAPTDGRWINVKCEGDDGIYAARMAFYRERPTWFVKDFPEPAGHWGAKPVSWSEIP